MRITSDDDKTEYGHIGSITPITHEPVPVPEREFPPGFDLTPPKKKARKRK